MILYRAIFHAKLGKAADVVARAKAMVDELTDEQRASLQPRVLTDISGRFDTVILETTHADFTALGAFREARLNQRADADAPSTMSELVEHGYNEYYTIEL